MADWVAFLDEDELKTLVPATAVKTRNEELAGEKIGKELFAKGIFPPIKATLSAQKPPSVLALIKAELKDLVCTNSRKYAATRKKLGQLTSHNTLLIVSLIATAIDKHLGLTVAFCVPFISAVLLAMLQVGKNAFCAANPQATAPLTKKRP